MLLLSQLLLQLLNLGCQTIDLVIPSGPVVGTVLAFAIPVVVVRILPMGRATRPASWSGLLAGR